VTQGLAEALGPPPFRFELPDGQPLRGPAFSTAFKFIATALVAFIVGWFVQLWMADKVSGGVVSILSWFLAALAMIGYTWWCIVRSVTTLDTEALTQTWVWDKKMELRELAYAKLIRVRGFEWLIAPRLYVRTLMGKFAVFYAADPRMIAQFERLVLELKAFRSF
jgi:hypothetical protein